MKGSEEYNNKFKNKINNIINKNSDITILKGLYSSYSTQHVNKLSGKYTYLTITTKFLRTVNKKPENLNYNDYQIYINDYENKTISYQITIYAALKNLAHYLRASKINTDDPFYDKRILSPSGKESEETISKRNNGYMSVKEINLYKNTIIDGVGSHNAKVRQKKWFERDYALIQLMLNTGLRCSGIYRLDVSSIDYNTKILTTTEKEGKVRQIVLSDQMLELINNWLEKREKILKGKQEDALFISNRKTRLSSESIGSLVRKYSVNIEGKNITPHKLRHTFGTMLYNDSHDIVRTARALGHENTDVTKLYINEDEMQAGKENANIMSSIMF